MGLYTHCTHDNAFPSIVHKVYGCRFNYWSHHIISFFNNDFTQRKLDEIVLEELTKGHSLYQISSKMLHGSKVITLVEKKDKRWPSGFELTTSQLEVQCANHYTMETFMMN